MSASDKLSQQAQRLKTAYERALISANDHRHLVEVNQAVYVTLPFPDNANNTNIDFYLSVAPRYMELFRTINEFDTVRKELHELSEETSTIDSILAYKSISDFVIFLYLFILLFIVHEMSKEAINAKQTHSSTILETILFTICVGFIINILVEKDKTYIGVDDIKLENFEIWGNIINPSALKSAGAYAVIMLLCICGILYMNGRKSVKTLIIFVVVYVVISSVMISLSSVKQLKKYTVPLCLLTAYIVTCLLYALVLPFDVALTRFAVLAYITLFVYIIIRRLEFWNNDPKLNVKSDETKINDIFEKHIGSLKPILEKVKNSSKTDEGAIQDMIGSMPTTAAVAAVKGLVDETYAFFFNEAPNVAAIYVQKLDRAISSVSSFIDRSKEQGSLQDDRNAAHRMIRWHFNGRVFTDATNDASKSDRYILPLVDPDSVKRYRYCMTAADNALSLLNSSITAKLSFSKEKPMQVWKTILDPELNRRSYNREVIKEYNLSRRSAREEWKKIPKKDVDLIESLNKELTWDELRDMLQNIMEGRDAAFALTVDTTKSSVRDFIKILMDNLKARGLHDYHIQELRKLAAYQDYLMNLKMVTSSYSSVVRHRSWSVWVRDVEPNATEVFAKNLKKWLISAFNDLGLQEDDDKRKYDDFAKVLSTMDASEMDVIKSDMKDAIDNEIIPGKNPDNNSNHDTMYDQVQEDLRYREHKSTDIQYIVGTTWVTLLVFVIKKIVNTMTNVGAS
jgi:hypothetical protein